MEYNRPQINKQPYDINFSYTQDGRLVVELYERFAEAKQGYDITKLIIDNRPHVLGNQYVQNCMVSWYGKDDCEYLKGYVEGYERRSDYKNVLAEIDFNLLVIDQNYCITVMKNLLNQKRVFQYLEMGLQENSKRPCGKYIGGIVRQEDRYRKIFDTALGMESHYSIDMCNARQNYKQRQQQIRAEAKIRKQAQIDRLKQEIEDLDR